MRRILQLDDKLTIVFDALRITIARGSPNRLHSTLPAKWRYTKIEYKTASAIPGIHQTSPMYNPYSAAAAFATVRPAPGELFDGSTYGNTPRAALVSIPPR